MILGVDWGPLTLGSSGGLVQWVQGILSAYIEKYPEDTLLMFMPDGLPIRFDSTANVHYHTARRSALARLTTEVLTKTAADVLVCCYPAPEPPDFPAERQIVIIPDMQHAERPQFFTQKDLKQRRLAFGYALANAGAIGTMTDFSRSTIVAYPWTDCDDIFLMPPGVRFAATEVDKAPETAEWRTHLRKFSGYFFMPANLWPHKNHRNLFEAFSRALPGLPAEIGLVTTGAGDGWGELLADYEALPIEHLGYVPTEHLPFLYRQALALTFFSSYEGFGMPLLEAFHFRTPVICSDIPALVEVGGDAVLTAPPNDVVRIAELLKRIAGDQALRKRLVENGRARLSHYSFNDSAAALREAAVRVREKVARGWPRTTRRLRISVLMDLADPGAKLARTCEAALQQSYDDFEVIPFGGSVPEELAADSRLRWPEGGPLVSPALAASEASGEIFVLVRGDCRLNGEALARIAAHFAEHRECDLVAASTFVEIDGIERKPGWTMELSEAEARLGESGRRLFATQAFEQRLIGEAGRDYRKCRPLVAWRRRIAEVAGGFDESLAYAYDADYYIRLVEAGAAVGKLRDPLATIVLSPDPSAARYWYLVMGDLRKIVSQQRGILGGLFFRLYRHRERGLEPRVTGTWDRFLSLQSWAERRIWSARRSLTSLTGRSLMARLQGRRPAV